jgi:glycosyltransferase involved in cell wall biosynthesis
MAAREAMAYGRPVVATDVGGLSDLGEGATLTPPGDIDALREAVTTLLGDADLRGLLGAKSRGVAATTFGSAAAAEQLRHTYEAALDASRSRR